MNRLTMKLALACLAIVMLVPSPAFGQVDAVNLTAWFVSGGVTIDELLVYQIGGVVLIRGRTSDPALAEDAGRFAVRAGYKRVANLIKVTPVLEDDAVARVVRQRLEMALELDGCRFQIESVAGIVRLRGQVTREVQRDFAKYMVGRIEGVKEVRSELTLSVPAARGGNNG